MDHFDLNETAGDKAKPHLGHQPEVLTSADTRATGQNVSTGTKDHRATTCASRSRDKFRDLKRHYAATQKAKRCLASGDLRGAIMAVVAYWDQT